MSDTALDDIQIKGIDEHPETESVVLHGPPGTGKTTTSAARVALLLRDHGYEISDVTWVTYRRSLADETLVRLANWDVIDERELADPTEGATRYISTIHAVANRVVGGLPEPVQDYHKRDFCDIQGMPYATPKPWDRSAGKELFACFEWLSENCYDPTNDVALHHYPNKDTLREHFRGSVGDMWEAWERYKDEKNRIDFHEQLQAAVNERASPGTDILVIDEYHDATPLIASVAELWMQDADIVIVAGDPHQVVNQYQGADPAFFERVADRYPKILLDKSWRVGTANWISATACLSRAHEPPNVEPTGTGEIREYRSPSFWYDSDSGWKTPTRSKPAAPPTLVDESVGDIMFLARTQMQCDGIGAALEQAGVLYTSQKELGGWNTPRGQTRLALYNALTKIRGVSPNDFDGATAGLARFDDGRTARTPGQIHLRATEAVELLQHIDGRKGYLALSGNDERKELCERITANETPVSLDEFDEWVTPSFWGTYTHGAQSEPAGTGRAPAGAAETQRTDRSGHHRCLGPDDPRLEGTRSGRRSGLRRDHEHRKTRHATRRRRPEERMADVVRCSQSSGQTDAHHAQRV